MEKMRAYREVIHENIDYQYHAKEDVDELVELMIEVMMMPEDSMIRIAGVEKPVALQKPMMNLEKMKQKKRTITKSKVKKSLLAATTFLCLTWLKKAVSMP